MAPVTDLPTAEPGDLSLKWSGRVSLTPRILAVNIFALALLAGSLFYLDGYRSRLIDERMSRAVRETQLVASALAVASPRGRRTLINEYGRILDTRLRLTDSGGTLLIDSWHGKQQTFDLRDPELPPWQQTAARWLDIVIDFIVGAIEPPDFSEASTLAVPRNGETSVRLSYAADRTHVLSSVTRLPGASGLILMSDRNARDIRRIVRAERARLGSAVAATAILSVLLSLFLARTIVRPLRSLARAAVRVRLGRSREVVIPRLPDRRDEIGMLARAVSDMSQALRQRIDATESFAADVAHELKNPLASLRSAIESLGSVGDPGLRDQLISIASDDVRRLDRLLSDIAELSRIDARLSRARFVPVDLAVLASTIVAERAARAPDVGAAVTVAAPVSEPTLVRGDAAQLARVVENLLDNAQSFSPPGSSVAVHVTRDGGDVIMTVDDDGPGIPPALREAVFERFHSDRPDAEQFGQHSGLGLAIARTIVEGHGGAIVAGSAAPHKQGARLIVRIPARSGDPA